MDALLDVVLPASPSGDMPAAGALGLSAAVAAGVRADPLLGPVVGPGLDALRDAALLRTAGGLPAMSHEDAAEFVTAQFSGNPMLMMGFLRHVYPAYYANPLVLAGIGDPPRPAFPEGFDVEPTDPALLALLAARARTRRG
jgi:hypothetical protein